MDKQIDRLWATSKTSWHWAFPRLKLGFWWQAGSNPTCISQEYACFHHLRKHHLARRQQGQDNEMPLHHGIHSHSNSHHQSMVHCRLCLVRPWTTMVTQKTPLSHWRWSFHANTNEVPSLIIKIAGVSLTNKEEELSTMPLEDKDNQGGTWVASPMNPNSSTKNQQKSRKVDGRRACNCPYPHLQDKMV